MIFTGAATVTVDQMKAVHRFAAEKDP